MRSQFDQQLELLNLQLIEMGALCEEAISLAVKALLRDQDDLLPRVFSTDSEIDQKERDIEGMCLKLLLQQQPVARDLRVISSALKMISDMERIGDQAADISEITRHIQTPDLRDVPIGDMARAAVGMVTDSIDSFVKKDLALAQKVMADDDRVDDLFIQVREELIRLLRVDGSRSETSIDLLMIAKYLERIGDHAVNIAEWVEFSITGHHPSSEEADQ